MNVRELAGLLFLCSFACAAQAGPELSWSHSTLTGQEAQERFLRDSPECIEHAAVFAPVPQEPRPGYVASTSDSQSYQETARAIKREQIKKAVACMSMRGWSWQTKY